MSEILKKKSPSKNRQISTVHFSDLPFRAPYPGPTSPKMEMEPCSLAGLNGDPFYAIRQNRNTKLENQQKV